MTKEFLNAVVNECVWLNEEHPDMHTCVLVTNNSEGQVSYDMVSGYYNEVMDAYSNRANQVSQLGISYILYVDGKIMSSFDTNGLKWEK